MKKYYKTLNKEKQKEIKELYKKKYKGSELEIRLKRLIFYTIIAYIFGTSTLISTFITDTSKITNIIITIILYIVGTAYLIGVYIIKQNVLNDLALKNK